jgi:1-piperideine-2-carboxylate/1-pyrroline-2-carboxylate reductase [NAD(P)H]
MQFFDASATRLLLPFGPLVQAFDGMLEKLRTGNTTAPVRSSIGLANGGVLLMMPAADTQFASLKTVTVHMANTAKGIPVIQGAVLLMDATNGQRLAVFDGPTLTAQRTAALSLAGALKLKGKPQGKLLIVGAGAQAAAHARAFWTEGNLQTIYISALGADVAKPLLAQLRAEGIRVEWIDNPAQVIAEVQTIITVTTSSTPVIPDAVPADALVIAVGAFTPEMAELPVSLVQRSQLFVDTHAGAKAEAGDFLQAKVDWNSVTPLEAIQQRPQSGGRPIIFKTVGYSLWDLAAAELAYSRAQGAKPAQ